ncbi:hypothetical protein GH714_022643 [Hevea brasiliensis]|uniref:AAA+ ATPase domain-containing protein n=1 Tax=Hevea brasiliensis TaxID=3981 RepID=A0A6A6LLA1_HEVBR|nr:hypothetical protein GH714_022643 [Hevea brasiliensis]
MPSEISNRIKNRTVLLKCHSSRKKRYFGPALKNKIAFKKLIEERVTREETQLRQRTPKVTLWLHRVEDKQNSVDEVIKEGEEEILKKCARCFFPKNFCAYQEVGKNVSSELNDLNKLIEEGEDFGEVTETKISYNPVDEKPLEEIVGLESEFNQVWKCLEDQSVRTIGIYGMGGVGKTTLLKKVNNQFLKNHGFFAVIWIDVSKQANVEKIQEAIFNKFIIPELLWKDKDEQTKARVIMKCLTGKKFVLLLDDLWKHLDLQRIGIPSSDKANGSKVVFTTRSEEVCGREGTLNSHRDISKLAEMVAQKCQGLPLALITIGRAMNGRRNPDEWEDALKSLQNYPSDFHEDYIIEKDELFELWIREGFLVKYYDRYDARKAAESTLTSLKFACLLEDGVIPQDWTGDPQDYIRMHDVIRDMALGMASKHEIKMEVLEDAALFKLKAEGFDEKWKEVKRLSLLGKSYESFSESMSPAFPHLLTFFVRYTKLNRFPGGFFQQLHTLNILDLSRNWDLTELPSGIGVLINLQHLNLSHTRIKSLPLEVKNLRKLKSLLMDGTYDLANIPRGVISSLSLLQVFTKTQLIHDKLFDEGGLLEELESLEYLNDVCITLTNLSSIQKYMSSLRLESYIRGLLGSTCNLTSFEMSSSILRIAKHLEVVAMLNCPHLEELLIYPARQAHFQDLRYLNIWGCPRIKDLSTWVIHAPRLQTLVVCSCSSFEEIIADRFSSAEMDIFPNLRLLILKSLPQLRSICHQILPFPSLQVLRVTGCPSLKKLPFDSNSAKNNLEKIEGRRVVERVAGRMTLISLLSLQNLLAMAYGKEA